MTKIRRNRRSREAVILMALLTILISYTAIVQKAPAAEKSLQTQNTGKSFAKGLSEGVTNNKTKATGQDDGLTAGISAMFCEELRVITVQNTELTAGVSEAMKQILINPVSIEKLENDVVASSGYDDAAIKNQPQNEDGSAAIEETVDSTEVQASAETNTQAVPDPYEVYLLAHIIYAEAGNQSYECQLAVGQVVINRVHCKIDFENTIEGVIYEPGQYGCIVNNDGNFQKEPSQQAWDIAYYLLENEMSENPVELIPKDVVWQAGIVQGHGIWKKYGPIYFCYL